MTKLTIQCGVLVGTRHLRADTFACAGHSLSPTVSEAKREVGPASTRTKKIILTLFNVTIRE